MASRASPNDSPRCVILGGGGHARMLIDCLLLAGTAQPYAILDPDESRWGETLYGVPILGEDALLANLALEGIAHFVVGLGGVSDNRPRKRLFALGLSEGLKPLTVVHPTAIVSPWAEISPGCQLLPGSVVNAGAKLGMNVIVNSGAIVEHDCTLGDHVHMATGARLASAIHVGEGAHIGAGATIRQCIRIGAWAVVGAGAVVIRDVSPKTVVVGVPARPMEEKRRDAGERGG
jgi:sugar O-acyltransferase (sialic acid O-acetyltransferase NeuD family)